jgi:quaternary ammonium compound-resistance protein SugE
MTPTLAWIALVTSGLLDVAWALAMKKADGFANPPWSGISLMLLAVFVYLLTKALQVLPVGTAYAVWTGIGAAGTVVAGMVLFSALRPFFITVVVIGIAGLKMT